MCGRLSLFVDPRTLEEDFDAELSYDYEPRYNVAPGAGLATITNADPERIDRFEWGFVPPWADSADDGPRPINARAESVDDKPLFRDAFRNRRCLVLADGYYEWQEPTHPGPKQPYRISLADDRPFALAGLWNRWNGRGETVDSVTIVTTEASEPVASVHDRMPVLLEPGQKREWLRAEPGEAMAYLQPYGNANLEVYPISAAVNDPSNDGPELIAETSISTQRGLDEFGG